MMNFAATSALRPEIADAGRIRLGAAGRRHPAPPAAIADAGKIRVGAAGRTRPRAR